MSLPTFRLSSARWLRLVAGSVLFAVAVGCGGSQTSATDEPQTAKEKQRRDAQASGDVDQPGGKWGGWRYAGDSEDCFFLVGKRCFKTEKAACHAAKCASKKCQIAGGGPARVTCAPADN
jgi:hypothetical protein